MGKRYVIILILIISFYILIGKTYPLYKPYLSPELERIQKNKIGTFILDTGFQGTSRLTNDKRVFQNLTGTFPLPEIKDMDDFNANCDSILKAIMSLYSPSDVSFSFYTPEKNTDRVTSVDSRAYYSLFRQSYSGWFLNVLSNYSAYNEFRYKKQLGADSLLDERSIRNKYLYSDSLSQYTYERIETSYFRSTLEINYYKESNTYSIENNLFLEPVTLPELKYDKEDIEQKVVQMNKGNIIKTELKLFAFPMNPMRSKFEYKFVWYVETSWGHGGLVLNIDATTGKLINQGGWME